MKARRTRFNGLAVIELETYRDTRGFFRETYRREAYLDAGIADDFPQENHSHSGRNVLRGLHLRVGQPQAQLVTVMRGRIFDVVVDVRPDSLTFGEWFGVELSADGEAQQVYMAPGFAHGFCVLSDAADVHYRVGRTFDPNDDAGILWNDPELGIPWPIRDPVVSDKDARHPTFATIVEQLA